MLLTVVYYLAWAALPLYTIYVSLTLRPSWRRSKARAGALVFLFLPLLAFLASPLLYAY